MGTPKDTAAERLTRWWYRNETRILKAFCAIGFLVIAAFLITGCASANYNWTKTQPASPRPWFHVTALDVDLACRQFGAQSKQGERINGCAQQHETHCLILLPENAPAWVIAHEEKHCEGFSHE